MPLELALYHEWLDEEEAKVFAALTKPLHIRIVHMLTGTASTAAELARRLGGEQTKVEDALHALTQAGVVVPSTMMPPPLYSLRTGLADALRNMRAAVGEVFHRSS